MENEGFNLWKHQQVSVWMELQTKLLPRCWDLQIAQTAFNLLADCQNGYLMLHRTTSWQTSCAGSCRQTRQSTASPAWRPTPGAMLYPAPLTTCPFPLPCTGRATSELPLHTMPADSSSLRPRHCQAIIILHRDKPTSPAHWARFWVFVRVPPYLCSLTRPAPPTSPITLQVYKKKGSVLFSSEKKVTYFIIQNKRYFLQLI